MNPDANPDVAKLIDAIDADVATVLKSHDRTSRRAGVNIRDGITKLRALLLPPADPVPEPTVAPVIEPAPEAADAPKPRARRKRPVKAPKVASGAPRSGEKRPARANRRPVTRK